MFTWLSETMINLQANFFFLFTVTNNKPYVIFKIMQNDITKYFRSTGVQGNGNTLSNVYFKGRLKFNK